MMWQLVVISAAVIIGFLKLANNQLALKVEPLKAAFFSQLFGSLLFLIFANDFVIPASNEAWFFIIIGSLLWSCFSVLFLLSYKHLGVTFNVTLTELRTVIVLFLAVVLLGELITLQKYLGVLLIVSGAFIATYKIKSNKGFDRKGLVYFLLLTIVGSFNQIVDKVGVNLTNVATYGFLVYFFPTVILFLFSKFRKSDLSVSRRELKLIFLVTFLGFVAYVLSLYAYTITDLINVELLTKLSIVVAFLGGHFWFKEKGLKLKAIAAVIIVIGSLIILL